MTFEEGARLINRFEEAQTHRAEIRAIHSVTHTSVMSYRNEGGLGEFIFRLQKSLTALYLSRPNVC